MSENEEQAVKKSPCECAEDICTQILQPVRDCDKSKNEKDIDEMISAISRPFSKQPTARSSLKSLIVDKSDPNMNKPGEQIPIALVTGCNGVSTITVAKAEGCKTCSKANGKNTRSPFQLFGLDDAIGECTECIKLDRAMEGLKCFFYPEQESYLAAQQAENNYAKEDKENEDNSSDNSLVNHSQPSACSPACSYSSKVSKSSMKKPDQRKDEASDNIKVLSSTNGGQGNKAFRIQETDEDLTARVLNTYEKSVGSFVTTKDTATDCDGEDFNKEGLVMEDVSKEANCGCARREMKTPQVEASAEKSNSSKGRSCLPNRTGTNNRSNCISRDSQCNFNKEIKRSANKETQCNWSEANSCKDSDFSGGSGKVSKVTTSRDVQNYSNTQSSARGSPKNNATLVYNNAGNARKVDQKISRLNVIRGSASDISTPEIYPQMNAGNNFNEDPYAHENDYYNQFRPAVRNYQNSQATSRQKYMQHEEESVEDFSPVARHCNPLQNMNKSSQSRFIPSEHLRRKTSTTVYDAKARRYKPEVGNNRAYVYNQEEQSYGGYRKPAGHNNDYAVPNQNYGEYRQYSRNRQPVLDDDEDDELVATQDYDNAFRIKKKVDAIITNVLERHAQRFQRNAQGAYSKKTTANSDSYRPYNDGLAQNHQTPKSLNILRSVQREYALPNGRKLLKTEITSEVDEPETLTRCRGNYRQYCDESESRDRMNFYTESTSSFGNRRGNAQDAGNVERQNVYRGVPLGNTLGVVPAKKKKQTQYCYID